MIARKCGGDDEAVGLALAFVARDLSHLAGLLIGIDSIAVRGYASLGTRVSFVWSSVIQ